MLFEVGVELLGSLDGFIESNFKQKIALEQGDRGFRRC
jgi:hypothetical protein